MLHRDITPANVMLRNAPVTSSDQVVLVDFGLSKRVDQKGQTITVGQMILGTPDYLSVEVAKGLEPKDFDTRVDVWAAGVVLYEMLAGKRPFSGRNYLALFQEIYSKKQENSTRVRVSASACQRRV